MKNLIKKWLKKESAGWFFILTIPLILWFVGLIITLTSVVPLGFGELWTGIPMMFIGILMFVSPFIFEKRVKRWMEKMLNKGYFSEK